MGNLSDGTITEAKRYEMLQVLRELSTDGHRSLVLNFIGDTFGEAEMVWLRDRLKERQ